MDTSPIQTENTSPSSSSLTKVLRNTLSVLLVLILCVWIIGYTMVWRTPSDFPVGAVFTIAKGDSLQKTAINLSSSSIIRSPLLFRSFVILLGGEKKVVAGDYLFDVKENPLAIAWRIIHGDFHMEEIKVTIPEGTSVQEMGVLFQKELVSFDTKTFISIAKKKEGYLFPDTYFFPPASNTEDIVSRMSTVYENKIAPLRKEITSFGKSEKEIITMASILEGEAKTTTDRKIVAGILWKRIALRMPLQVDATFQYINGKTTKELTRDDLMIDSPYNTYVYRGLPPTPINNPGIDAILSALRPTKTDYLYFLTGRDGKMYYAKTFEEHKRNKEKFL